MSALANRKEQEFAFSDKEFAEIANFIAVQTGIQLPIQKKNLVYSRLARRLRELNLTSFHQYLAFIKTPEGEAESGRMINALTTNHTKFFREEHHFQHMASTAIAALQQKGQKSLRIWSAGCSLGAEPYTIAMVLHQTLPDIGAWDIKILCSDLDTDVLEKAHAGVYGRDAASEIPAAYFRAPVHVQQDSGGGVIMPDTLKSMMRFKRLNLLHPWPMKHKFDIIFCRNVLIYFDRPTQDTLFARFAESIKPNGYFYIGHSENIRGLESVWQNHGQTIYQRRGV